MAYNPYSATNAIYRLKGQWNKADKANDDEGKNAAAEKAQAYYEQLKKNGYSDLADELASSGEAAAKSINDKWAKMGKTPTRDYLYSMGKSRGMSKSDVDNLVSWDDQSGEVSFGGKKIGKPDAVVDGTSYFKDTRVLDNAFNDYIERSGTVRPKSTAVNQENENLFKRYKQEYDDLKETNPFTTEEAKAILSKYDLAGLQGRDNAVASNAGSNGGNIDSFAAANALRQQASLVSQGQQAVLTAYQQKLDHARSLLSDMGVNIDRVYNQDETSKNNDVARKSEMASVTGYTPAEWTIKNDAFLKNFVDDNGNLKPEYENIDFQALINNAKAKGDTSLADKYAILRAKKIFGDVSKYGKYLSQGDVSYLRPQKTEAARQFDEQIAQADRTLNSESALKSEELKTQERINSADNQNALDQIKEQGKLTASQAIAALKNGEKSQAVIDTYNQYFGTDYTVDNPPSVYNSAAAGASNEAWEDATEETSGTATEESNKIFSGWKDAGIQNAVILVEKPSNYEALIKTADVDKHGKNAIDSVYTAISNGQLGAQGYVSAYDLADYLILRSDANDTNKNQLEKVFAYFDLDKRMLDEVDDAGTMFWNWHKGVKYNNSSSSK